MGREPAGYAGLDYRAMETPANLLPGSDWVKVDMPAVDVSLECPIDLLIIARIGRCYFRRPVRMDRFMSGLCKQRGQLPPLVQAQNRHLTLVGAGVIGHERFKVNIRFVIKIEVTSVIVDKLPGLARAARGLGSEDPVEFVFRRLRKDDKDENLPISADGRFGQNGRRQDGCPVAF
jgi:hypothetical protein